PEASDARVTLARAARSVRPGASGLDATSGLPSYALRRGASSRAGASIASACATDPARRHADHARGRRGASWPAPEYWSGSTDRRSGNRPAASARVAERIPDLVHVAGEHRGL